MKRCVVVQAIHSDVRVRKFLPFRIRHHTSLDHKSERFFFGERMIGQVLRCNRHGGVVGFKKINAFSPLLALQAAASVHTNGQPGNMVQSGD